MTALRLEISFALTIFSLAAMTVQSKPFNPRGIQFIPFESLATFEKSPGGRIGEMVLTSPEIRARVHWNELIASWNAVMPATAYLKIEVRAICPGNTTKWYVMGLWSSDPLRHPRESVLNQKDADGEVDTDTLMLAQPAERFQLRLTLGGDENQLPEVKFFCVSLLEAHTTPSLLPPNRAAWGKLVDVPERSQMAYENGSVLCSPTTVSMMLSFWSKKLNRVDLDRDVPEVVKGVFDPKWEGTGNWVFNTAYAGSFPGMRAYTARLIDVAELEDWIAHGMPVGLSVCYNRLRGKGPKTSGHLIVCVGFTAQGDVIVNDPGTSQHVRKIFPRANLIDAWAYKHNTVYFMYPEHAKLPKDRFGHWDSEVARKGALGGQ